MMVRLVIHERGALEGRQTVLIGHISTLSIRPSQFERLRPEEYIVQLGSERVWVQESLEQLWAQIPLELRAFSLEARRL